MQPVRRPLHTTQAIVVSDYGGPEKLQYGSAGIPDATEPGELVVRIEATEALNCLTEIEPGRQCAMLSTEFVPFHAIRRERLLD